MRCHCCWSPQTGYPRFSRPAPLAIRHMTETGVIVPGNRYAAEHQKIRPNLDILLKIETFKTNYVYHISIRCKNYHFTYCLRKCPSCSIHAFHTIPFRRNPRQISRSRRSIRMDIRGSPTLACAQGRHCTIHSIWDLIKECIRKKMVSRLISRRCEST